MVQLSEHVRRTHSAAGGVLLDLKQGRMFTLNSLGSKILELLDCRQTTAEIAAEISREFAIEAGAALRDVEEFLGRLAELRLIENRSQKVAS